MKITFWSGLQIALIVLKLCHVIKWSWVLVFIPIWGPPVAIVLGGGIWFVFMVFCKSTKKKNT